MKQLPVDLVGQDTDQWCWAATAEMIMRFHGTVVRQCEQAAVLHEVPNACDPRTPRSAIEPGWPEFARWGFLADQRPDDTCLTMDEVKQQIDADRPFAFAWRWTGGGGHMMAAVGYTASNGEDFVVVNNPWPPRRGDTDAYTYASFVGGEGVRDQFETHTHWRDYVNIVPDPGAGALAAAPGGPGGAGSPSHPAIQVQLLHDTIEGAVGRGQSVLRDLIVQGYREGLVTDTGEDAPGGPAAETRDLVIGEPDRPIPVGYIFRDNLERWEPGTELRDAIAWGSEVIVPLLSGGQVVSSVVAVSESGAWAIRKVGSPNLTRAIVDTRNALSVREGRSPDEYFVIRIPHLYRVFLGRDDGPDIELTPVLETEPPERIDDAAPGAGNLRALQFERGGEGRDQLMSRLSEESADWPSALPEVES